MMTEESNVILAEIDNLKDQLKAKDIAHGKAIKELQRVFLEKIEKQEYYLDILRQEVESLTRIINYYEELGK